MLCQCKNYVWGKTLSALYVFFKIFEIILNKTYNLILDLCTKYIVSMYIGEYVRVEFVSIDIQIQTQHKG